MKKILFFFGIFFVFLVFAALLPQQQSASIKPFRFIPFQLFQKACGFPLPGFARCHAQIVTDSSGRPQAALLPAGTAFGPAEFHIGYQLPCTPGGAVNSHCSTPSSFGPTIGIVDAYNDPTVANDLAVYDSNYNLPSCTTSSGCLQIVNQNGGTSLPSTNSGWALEESLDVQIAHDICQTCKILLVEANSSSISDLGTGVNTAASLGAVAISNSYGASEWSGETSYDTYYNHAGVAITASSGDSGYGTEFPASSPYVTAVGGTTLQLYSDDTYATEAIWNKAGSGCSNYENANSWQTGLSNWGATGCGTKRAIADIAADADPNTGAAVYDSTPYSGSSGWWMVGGTSLSSPLIASVYAMAGVSSGNPATTLYNNASSFHDVTTGSNGSCSTVMCKGATGYDGPSGLGTPDGLGGFIAGSSATPTPTPSSTPTPTPTATPTPIDTTPPTISIQSPANNSLVRHGSRVTIAATASDNVKVAKVEFFINNKLVATKTNSPYSYNWSVPWSRNVVYTIAARAFDTSGNTATASVTVTSY